MLKSNGAKFNISQHWHFINWQFPVATIILNQNIYSIGIDLLIIVCCDTYLQDTNTAHRDSCLWVKITEINSFAQCSNQSNTFGAGHSKYHKWAGHVKQGRLETYIFCILTGKLWYTLKHFLQQIYTRAPNDARFAHLWRTRTETEIHPLQVWPVCGIDPLNWLVRCVFTL